MNKTKIICKYKFSIISLTKTDFLTSPEFSRIILKSFPSSSVTVVDSNEPTIPRSIHFYENKTNVNILQKIKIMSTFTQIFHFKYAIIIGRNVNTKNILIG